MKCVDFVPEGFLAPCSRVISAEILIYTHHPSITFFAATYSPYNLAVFSFSWDAFMLSHVDFM